MTFFLFQLNQYYQFWGIQKYEKTCFCASLTTYNLEHLNFRLLDTKCNTNIWYSASFLVFCSLLIQCILAAVSPPSILPSSSPHCAYCLPSNLFLSLIRKTTDFWKCVPFLSMQIYGCTEACPWTFLDTNCLKIPLSPPFLQCEMFPNSLRFCVG